MAKIQLYFKGGTGAPQVLEVEEELAKRIVKENPSYEYYGKPKKDIKDIVLEKPIETPKKVKK